MFTIIPVAINNSFPTRFRTHMRSGSSPSVFNFIHRPCGFYFLCKVYLPSITVRAHFSIVGCFGNHGSAFETARGSVPSPIPLVSYQFGRPEYSFKVKYIQANVFLLSNSCIPTGSSESMLLTL
jgi:hypothetical protein